MNYREVKCSDRLPEKEGIYFVIGKEGEKFADRFTKANDSDTGMWYSTPIHRIKYWLEPYELPTEEEIQTAIESGIFEIPSDSYPDKAVVSLKTIRRAITNLLKEER